MMLTYTLASEGLSAFLVRWYGPTVDTSGEAVVDGPGLDVLTEALDRNDFSLIQGSIR